MARILLVEDDVDLRFMVRFRLERAGFEVDEAGDGVAALERLLAGPPPDALLADLAMPRMDGLTLLRWVRETPALDGLPVLVLSAHATPEDVDELIALGCRSCLAKPFSHTELVAALRRIIDTASSPSYAAA
jgi:CheY-like chemotaxis protein